MKHLLAFLDDEQGASMAEYAMLLAIVSVTLVAAISLFRDQIAAAFNRSASTLGSSR